MSQSCACSLFFAKTNEKDACSGVPQSSSLPQSCAKEKSSGVEIVMKKVLLLFKYCLFLNTRERSQDCNTLIRETVAKSEKHFAMSVILNCLSTTLPAALELNVHWFPLGFS